MKIKIDLKAFRNITEKYEQLMNMDEIPEVLKSEFLQEADNVLRQCNRIIRQAEAQELFFKKKSKYNEERIS